MVWSRAVTPRPIRKDWVAGAALNRPDSPPKPAPPGYVLRSPLRQAHFSAKPQPSITVKLDAVAIHPNPIATSPHEPQPPSHPPCPMRDYRAHQHQRVPTMNADTRNICPLLLRARV